MKDYRLIFENKRLINQYGFRFISLLGYLGLIMFAASTPVWGAVLAITAAIASLIWLTANLDFSHIFMNVITLAALSIPVLTGFGVLPLSILATVANIASIVAPLLIIGYFCHFLLRAVQNKQLKTHSGNLMLQGMLTLAVVGVFFGLNVALVQFGMTVTFPYMIMAIGVTAALIGTGAMVQRLFNLLPRTTNRWLNGLKFIFTIAIDLLCLPYRIFATVSQRTGLSVASMLSQLMAFSSQTWQDFGQDDLTQATNTVANMDLIKSLLLLVGFGAPVLVFFYFPPFQIAMLVVLLVETILLATVGNGYSTVQNALGLKTFADLKFHTSTGKKYFLELCNQMGNQDFSLLVDDATKTLALDRNHLKLGNEYIALGARNNTLSEKLSSILERHDLTTDLIKLIGMAANNQHKEFVEQLLEVMVDSDIQQTDRPIFRELLEHVIKENQFKDQISTKLHSWRHTRPGKPAVAADHLARITRTNRRQHSEPAKTTSLPPCSNITKKFSYELKMMTEAEQPVWQLKKTPINRQSNQSNGQTKIFVYRQFNNVNGTMYLTGHQTTPSEQGNLSGNSTIIKLDQLLTKQLKLSGTELQKWQSAASELKPVQRLATHTHI